jgi:hypothetical protein
MFESNEKKSAHRFVNGGLQLFLDNLQQVLYLIYTFSS